MKSIDKTHPDSWREDEPPTRSVELFLDFDPVAPESPQENPDVSPCDDERRALSGDAMAVITIDDFRRLTVAGDLHL